MEFTFAPIGFVRGGGNYPQEAPRQGVFARNEGVIELLPERNFETALADLGGFERIWIVFVFDRNRNWKPKVRPPDGAADRRIGLFATRSPHRPNPVGISAVELVRVEGLRVHIRNFDLLDGTPVLDIKPYIPAADAFPDSAAGWRDELDSTRRELFFAEEALGVIGFIRSHGGPDLENAARVQLATRALDPRRQRLTELDRAEHLWLLAFRTWRIVFTAPPVPEPIRVERIYGGYSAEELQPGAPDPYRDKALHRLVRRAFPPSEGK